MVVPSGAKGQYRGLHRMLLGSGYQEEEETGKEESWDMGERIGTVVPRKEGGFLCAGDSGIYTFDSDSEDKTNLADPEAGKRPDNRFNDGKCDPSGRFWAGSISTVKKTGDANLYMFDLSNSQLWLQ